MFLKVLLLCALVVCVVEVNAGTRVARSPQFGSASQASAQASSGGFGRPGQFGPGLGGPGYGRPRLGGSGFGLNRPRSGANISISKSVSISTGNGGVARSSAQSSSG